MGAQTADAVLGGRVIVKGVKGVGGVGGADVFARREGTKVRRKVKADARGVYLFPPLPPGTWDVEASAAGHTIAVVSHVRLGVAQSRRLDLTLEPADSQEMVTFFDFPPLRETGPAVGIRLDRWELSDLPLRSRSVTDLLSLSPISAPPETISTRLDAGVVGATRDLDLVPLSSIHAVAIVSHSYGADFGGSDGIVSLVTRSGGATRTGNAFATYRDPDLEAPAARRHLGASFGGPLPLGPADKTRSHVFAAAETVQDDAGGDQSMLAVRGDRHDAQNLLRWGYSGSDTSSADRFGSLRLGWQTQASSGLYVDFLGQETRSERSDLLQLRSDVYAAISAPRSFHDLAFGAESLSTSEMEHWSLYARDRWLVSDRLTLIVGARGDFEDPTGSGVRTSESRVAPRLGWIWRLTADGAHLLRGGAGRFHEALHEADQFSLGWSWQMHPFLGVAADAVSVASRNRPEGEYDAVTVTARSRFTDVFQVRASVSWTDPAREDTGEDPALRDRTVVTGLYQAPAGVLVALVYRNEVQPGVDLRVAKRVPMGSDVALELMAEVFNVFDEAAPLEAAEGRRMGQLGLRLSF